MRYSTLFILVISLLAACSDVKEGEDGGDRDRDHGLVTALILNVTDSAGNTAVYEWADPTLDGSNVTIDEVVLTAGEIYDVNVEVRNQLEEPVEDVTVQIIELDDEHQFFFTGSGVVGPASDSSAAVIEHSYSDTDRYGLPFGIDNTFDAFARGSGDLEVTLRHLPPEDGVATKYDGMADTVKTGGFAAIGGDNDAQVVFPLTVN
jgi:hypothetical protein